MSKRLNALLRHVSPDKVTKLNINNAKFSGSKLANAFNKHFFNVANTTTVRSDLTKIPLYPSSNFLNPVNKYEVITTIIHLSNSTAKDVEGIQM